MVFLLQQFADTVILIIHNSLSQEAFITIEFLLTINVQLKEDIPVV